MPKVINATSPNIATLTHRGTNSKFYYLSVTRPTLEFESVDVLSSHGNKIFIPGASKWKPIEFEVTADQFDFVLAHTPCNIEFNIGADFYVAMRCYVRQDSILKYILKIHTTNVRLI